ncbi:MAG: ATP-binding protein [Burkholderiaceae bacterium]|nr:ATP-binding protein [Burkholderiaceae bacterium]
MARLVFFAGHAGAGKTTLALRAVPLLHARTGESFCVLDKDTVYGTYSARVMGLLTGDPDDRDSPVYLDNLRDLEYLGLLQIAAENLALGVNVVLVGPFSREVKSRRLFDAVALGVPVDTHISVVWVVLDEATAKARIIARGHPNDRYKLEHWEEYRKRRFDPDAALFPALRRFDNTVFDAAAFDRLIDALATAPPRIGQETGGARGGAGLQRPHSGRSPDQ